MSIRAEEGSDFHAWFKGLDEGLRESLVLGTKVAEAIKSDVMFAENCWGLNAELDRQLRSGLGMAYWLDERPVPGLSAVRQALFESTVLSMIRVTDNHFSAKHGSAATLCSIAEILGKTDVCDALKTPQWSARLRTKVATDPVAISKDVNLRLKSMGWLMERVPSQWPKTGNELKSRELFEVRERLKPIRDKLIAHTDLDIPRPFKPNSLGGMLDRTRTAARHACRLFCVPLPSRSVKTKNLSSEVTEFWDIFALGLARQRNPER